jgi:hypothetical protein
MTVCLRGVTHYGVHTSSCFLPSQSGFLFGNSYPPGTNYPVVSLPLVGNIVAGDAANGLCGGFVLAALDLFCHSPRLLPQPDKTPPPSGSPIFNYLVQRLLNSFGVPSRNFNAGRVIEWIHTPGHEVLVSIVTGLAKRVVQQEWPRIKADIDSGVPSPLNLVAAQRSRRLAPSGRLALVQQVRGLVLRWWCGRFPLSCGGTHATPQQSGSGNYSLPHA